MYCFGAIASNPGRQRLNTPGAEYRLHFMGIEGGCPFRDSLLQQLMGFFNTGHGNASVISLSRAAGNRRAQAEARHQPGLEAAASGDFVLF